MDAQELSAMEVDVIKHDELDDDQRPKRKGTEWTASAHIITAVIGSGVLSVPWSIGQLGWIAGPIVLVAFAWVTLFTSRLLADCYRHPDPVTGRRNYIYMDAVKVNLSRKAYMICGITQYSNLVGTSIGYTITAATAARAIQKTNCYEKTGGEGECLANTTPYIAVYGFIQILLSLIPNFADIWWLSYLAAIMSFSYAFIALGLGIYKASTKSSHDYGSITGVAIGDPSLDGFETEAQKVWNIFIALGNIAFAYSYSMILIEIQNTLKAPKENKQMKRATLYGISATTFFYATVGIAGYSAFGNVVCGNILTCFQQPYWLVDFANTCVVIHLIGAYQVYTQPIFQFVELTAEKRYPNSTWLKADKSIKLPGGIAFNLNVFRVFWRTTYVIITTLISMVLPFFNDILGILGSIGFWPLTVYFPLQMFIKQHGIQKFSTTWILLQTLSFFTFLISLAALIGSIEGIIIDVQDIKLFKPT